MKIEKKKKKHNSDNPHWILMEMIDFNDWFYRQKNINHMIDFLYPSNNENRTLAVFNQFQKSKINDQKPN